MTSVSRHPWLSGPEPEPDVESRSPKNLPEDRTATFNAGLHGKRSGFSEPASSVVPATYWRVQGGGAEEAAETLPPPEFRAPAAGASEPGVQYTLHRVIASGGFGEIWEGTQESLGRVVAVKRLKQGLIETYRDDPEQLRRLEHAFRQEAFVAACLEHPNILPVHDLGVDEFGHLLLATKLVRGKPWSEILEEDAALPVSEFLDKHLEILESVVRAVAFAHSRGIVHRDLKPAQVMVGEFGEVLLMDWGIAMFVTDEPPQAPPGWDAIAVLAPTPSTASNPAGTPVYMAPEQTEETVTNIGTWTDIYLLGGILYELLTGCYPHSGRSQRQSFARASRGFVPSPWDAAPEREVPDELAAICATCLQSNPGNRLKTVDSLLLMLRNYRKGASRRREAEQLIEEAAARATHAEDYKSLSHCEELLARALALWPGHSDAQRLSDKLSVRHTSLAMRNRDLHLARSQAGRLTHDHPDRERLLGEIEHLEREQARVRQRLDEAYRRADRLVTFMLEDLHTSLRTVNRLDLMARVGTEALDYFESFADEKPTVELLYKRAVACRNIGDVFKSQGNTERAETAYRNFHQLCLWLEDEESESVEWKYLLAEALERASSVNYLKGELAECEELLGEATTRIEELLKLQPGNMEYRWLLGRIRHQTGISLWRRRELQTAFERHSEGLSILEELTSEFPDHKDIRGNLGWALSTLGNVYRDLGDLDSAIAATERAIQVRTELYEGDPDNKARLDDVGWSLSNMALLREYGGDFGGALEMFAQAEKWRRILFNGDPSNAVHRNTMAFILSSRGRILYGLERHDQAVQALREAVEMSRPLVETDASNLRELGGHALNAGYLALAEYAVGNRDAARELLEEARPFARKALDAIPENGVFQNAVCQVLVLEGLLAEENGDRTHARACWNEAVTLLGRQAWRENTGQGAGLHLELCLYLGLADEARQDEERLREKGWMLPRWARLLSELA